MKKLFYLFCVLPICISVYSQNFIWGEQFGGIGEDVVRGISVDSSGNTYLTGYFTDTSFFGSGENEVELQAEGWFDIFVSKTSPDGDLIWVKGFGGGFNEYGTGISYDSEGNVYVTGVFEGTLNFNPEGEGGLLSSLDDSLDIFVLKLDVDGNFVWVKSIGSPAYEETVSLGVDNDGNVYVLGYFYSTTNFNLGGEAFELTPYGGSDGFIAKFSDSGEFIWSQQFGGEEYEIPTAMKVLGNGDMYITGQFNGMADFNPNPTEIYFLSTDNENYRGIFLLHVNESGYLQEAYKVAEASQMGIAMDVGVDSQGNAYVTGNFGGDIIFAPSINGGEGLSFSSNSYLNGFISKTNPEGNVFWAKHLAPETSEETSSMGYGMAVNSLGEAFVTGFISGSIAFDDIVLNQQTDHYMDNFFAKINIEGEYEYAKVFGGADFIDNHFAGVDAEDNIYLSGTFEGNVNINPNGGNEVESRGFRDTYLIKLDNETLGIQEEVVKSETRIFPNPSDGVFYLSGESLSSSEKIEIYDLTGKKLVSKTIQSPYKIDLNSLKPGVYIMKVAGKSYRVIKK